MSVDVTLIYSFVVVLVSAIFLHRALFAPVGRVLDERAARAREDALARTQALEAVDQKLKDYQARIFAAKKQAFERREAIRRDGTGAKAEMVSRARDEAERVVAAGRAEVDAAAGTARTELRSEIERLAAQMATRILGRPVEGAR